MSRPGARFPRLSRLYWNLRLLGLPEPIRDLWMFAVTGLVVWAILSIQPKVDTAQLRADHAAQTVEQQKTGRRVAIKVLCGAQQGTIDAARASLTQPVGPPTFRRALERLGYPPSRVASKRAEQAVSGYSQLIAHAIEHEAGVRGLLDVKTGRLRCDKLVDAGRAK